MLNSPRYEPEPHCGRHWVDFMGIGAGECPCCVVERWFYPDEIGDAAHPSFIVEQRKQFVSWLKDTLSNSDQAEVEGIWLQIEDAPHLLIDRWRWETQPVIGRRSVKVSVCSWCGVTIGVSEHFGRDANQGEAVYTSHGKCDRCLEAEEHGAVPNCPCGCAETLGGSDEHTG